MSTTWLWHRQGARSVVYLLCACVFGLVALVGIEYGALWLYLIPATVCAVQYVFPTPLGWGAVAGLGSLATGAMVFTLLSDAARLALGKSPTVLIDTNDSVIFLLITGVLVAVTTWLFRLRPRRLVV